MHKDADLPSAIADRPEAGPDRPWTAAILAQPARLTCLAVIALSALYFAVHATIFYSRLDYAADGLGSSDLSDFFVFYASARHLWAGGPAWELYDTTLLKSFQMSLGAGSTGLHPFNYPPTYLFLIWPLGGLPYSVALIAWQLATLTLFAASLRFAGLRKIEILAALVAPVTILNFSSGQNGCLTSALLIGGLALLARRPVAAGGLFGLLTVKPHLGILVPVACLAERRWTAMIAAAGTAGLLIGASILVFEPTSWQAYFRFLGDFQARIQAQTGGDFLKYSATIFAAGQVLGLPNALAIGLQAVIGLGVGLVVYRAYRQPLDPALQLALLLVGASLVTPYGFLYDLPFVTVAVILVVRRGLRSGFLPFEPACLAAAWLVPFIGQMATERGLPVVPWVHLALFCFVLARLRKSARGSA